MRETRLSLLELGLIGATRGMLGIGIGILLSHRMGRDRRTMVGWTLAALGALSTIPLAMRVFRGSRALATNGHTRMERDAPFA